MRRKAAYTSGDPIGTPSKKVEELMKRFRKPCHVFVEDRRRRPHVSP